jgi:Trypsin-like peptidase domain
MRAVDGLMALLVLALAHAGGVSAQNIPDKDLISRSDDFFQFDSPDRQIISERQVGQASDPNAEPSIPKWYGRFRLEDKTKKFEYLGWNGVSDKVSGCWANSDDFIGVVRSGGIRMAISNDLTINLDFERLQWQLPKEVSAVVARFVDKQDKIIGTVEIKPSYAALTKIGVKLTPYDQLTNLLLGSDKIILSTNGVPNWTLSLPHISEVYQYMRRCAMQTAMETFDDEIGAPQEEPKGLKEAAPDVCSSQDYGWCLSRDPKYHGARHRVWERHSQHVQVPVVSSSLVQISESYGRSQKLVADQLYARVRLSSYVIVAHNEGDEKALIGSGVAVGPHTLLTNCHVAMQQTKKPKKFDTDKDGNIVKDKDGKEVEVEYEDWEHPWDKSYDIITISGADSDTAWRAKLIEPHCDADIAVLDTVADLYPINGIRDFDDLKIGEPVYAVGAPQGMVGTFTDGKLSNKLPHLVFNKLMPMVDLVVSSAPITPGNSGGGLFDQYGNVIALNESVNPSYNGLYFTVAVYQILRR